MKKPETSEDMNALLYKYYKNMFVLFCTVIMSILKLSGSHASAQKYFIIYMKQLFCTKTILSKGRKFFPK